MNLIKLAKEFTRSYYQTSIYNVLASMIDDENFEVLTTDTVTGLLGPGHITNYIKDEKYNEAGVYKWTLSKTFFRSKLLCEFAEDFEERVCKEIVLKKQELQDIKEKHDDLFIEFDKRAF